MVTAASTKPALSKNSPNGTQAGIAKIPSDLQQLNKRSVHRAMEIMGMRAALRAGTEIQAMGFHQRSSREYMKEFAKGVTHALTQRDKKFGDYRTASTRK